MKGTIGIRRPVVKGERFSAVSLAQALIDALLLPEALELRFPLGGVGAHPKPGLQEIQGVLIGTAFPCRRTDLLGLAFLGSVLLRHGGDAAKGIISPRRCPLPRWTEDPLGLLAALRWVLLMKHRVLVSPSVSLCPWIWSSLGQILC